MQYEKPILELWDLEEEEEVVTTSLSNGGDNGDGGDGDFVWPDVW